MNVEFESNASVLRTADISIKVTILSLPSANEVFTNMCQEFYPQGDVSQQALGQTSPGRYTPGQVHPLAGTPPGQVHPLAGTPPGQVHPLAGTPWQVHPLPWQVPPQGRYTPAGQVHPSPKATAADGMHPTGMHSC